MRHFGTHLACLVEISRRQRRRDGRWRIRRVGTAGSSPGSRHLSSDRVDLQICLAGIYRRQRSVPSARLLSLSERVLAGRLCCDVERFVAYHSQAQGQHQTLTGWNGKSLAVLQELMSRSIRPQARSSA